MDNASRDGSVEMLEAEFPWCGSYANAPQPGLLGGGQHGIEVHHRRVRLVLEPGHRHPGARRRSAGRVHGRIPRPASPPPSWSTRTASCSTAAAAYYTPTTLVMRRTPLWQALPEQPVVRRHLMLDYDHAPPRVVDWVIGACMLGAPGGHPSRRRHDERFFLYFEEAVDWCFPHGAPGLEGVVRAAKRDGARAPPRQRAARLSRSFWAHLGSILRSYEKWNRWAYAPALREVAKVHGIRSRDLVATNLAFLGGVPVARRLAPVLPNPLYTLENYKTSGSHPIVVLLALYFSGQYRIGRGKPPPTSCSSWDGPCSSPSWSSWRAPTSPASASSRAPSSRCSSSS